MGAKDGKAKQVPVRKGRAVAAGGRPPAPPAPAPGHEGAAPVPTPPRRRKRKLGKSADKKNCQQYSVYVKRKARRLVGRKLEDQRDDDPEFTLDFSELVQGLLELYLADRFTKRQLLDAAGGSTR